MYEDNLLLNIVCTVIGFAAVIGMYELFDGIIGVFVAIALVIIVAFIFEKIIKWLNI